MHINYIAVIVATVVSVVTGALWYSPALFAKKWMALVGKTEEELKKGGMGKAYAFVFLGALVQSYALAHLVKFMQSTTIIAGVHTGFLVWLGFVVTSNSGSTIFEGRPKELYFINMGFYFVVLLINGAILAVWQ